MKISIYLTIEFLIKLEKRENLDWHSIIVENWKVDIKQKGYSNE
jgi:hypothetical protein